MQTDPILREIYRIKDELNREIGGDLEKLFKRLDAFAKQHPERRVSFVPKPALPKKRQSATRKTVK